MNPIGTRRWAIAEGYIPSYSHGPQPQLTSHETVCILNAGDTDARVEITIYYSDRESRRALSADGSRAQDPTCSV